MNLSGADLALIDEALMGLMAHEFRLIENAARDALENGDDLVAVIANEKIVEIARLLFAIRDQPVPASLRLSPPQP